MGLLGHTRHAKRRQIVKFFIPYATDEEEAKRILEGVKRFAVETTGWPRTLGLPLLK